MKITTKRPVEIEITHIRLELPVRYGEEDMPNDFPLRQGNQWKAKVGIENGRIEGWPVGKEDEFYMKVVDMGNYYLLDPKGEIVGCIEENYVPHGVVPGEWGDYVHLKINGHGVITNWPRPGALNFEDFFRNE